MKKIILTLMACTIGLTGAMAQSIELTPNGGTTEITGASPRLLIKNTGSSYTGIKGIKAPSTDTYWFGYNEATDVVHIHNYDGAYSGTKGIFVDNDNRVGVGINSPQQPLHVVGDARIEDASPYLQMWRAAGSTSTAGFSFHDNGAATQGTLRYNYEDQYLQLVKGTSSSAGLFVDNSNNVGLNESEPTAKLHISGNSTPTIPHLRLYENNNSSADNITFENFNVTENWLIKVQASDTPINSNFKVKTSNLEVVTYTGDGNTKNHGFTQLGDIAPKVKMKKITGTTDADAQTLVAHGLSRDKILAVDIHTSNGLGVNYPPSGNGLQPTDRLYRYWINSVNIVLDNVGADLQGQSYWILITYEE